MTRKGERRADQLRKVALRRNIVRSADGSVLISLGQTKVICTAKVEEKVPHFIRGSGKGWITAEYGMLPASTDTRKPRPSLGRIDGRTAEIQRLIGRSLRAAADLSLLGERTVWIDCDVLQADGGTRVASITGGYVALAEALRKLLRAKLLQGWPLCSQVLAVSVGIVGGKILLDLDYEEDSSAEVDLNVVMTERGSIIEIQGTGEQRPFKRKELLTMLTLAAKGVRELVPIQMKALGGGSVR